MRLFEQPQDTSRCYFSVFLTQACNFNCPYCRQKFHLTSPQEPIHQARDIPGYALLEGARWVAALNAIEEPLPRLHVQGGEPSLHPDFHQILNGLKFNLTMDTNLSFDAERFVREVRRPVTIYCTFHPTQMSAEVFARNYHTIRQAGFEIYPSIIPDPYHPAAVADATHYLRGKGVPLSVSGYIGWVNGKLSPPFREEPYNGRRRKVLCRSREVLFAPDGSVYNCPAKLDRRGKTTYGNLLQGNASLPSGYVLCDEYGLCNPCSEFYTEYKEPT